MKAPVRPAPAVDFMVEAPASSAYKVWAAVGAAFLAVQAWTWASWLADGPGQITRFRDTSAPEWKWAIALQAFQVISTALVLVVVARDARRQRAVTLNVLYAAGCLCLVWLDPMLNYFRIGFFYSSNFLRLPASC